MTIGLVVYGVLNVYTTFKTSKYLFLYNKLLKNGLQGII